MVLEGNKSQASEGSDETSLWNGLNPYDNILNLSPPDFTTLLTIMNGEGYMVEFLKHHGSTLQDPNFVTLMNFMNSLRQETIGNGPYNVLEVLLREDSGEL